MIAYCHNFVNCKPFVYGYPVRVLLPVWYNFLLLNICVNLNFCSTFYAFSDVGHDILKLVLRWKISFLLFRKAEAFFLSRTSSASLQIKADIVGILQDIEFLFGVSVNIYYIASAMAHGWTLQINTQYETQYMYLCNKKMKEKQLNTGKLGILRMCFCFSIYYCYEKCVWMKI